MAIALATGNIGREGAGLHHDHRPGQRPGRPRARSEMRSVAGPARASRIRRAREHVAGVWGIAPDELPGPGYTAVEIMNAIHSGEIKGLLSICFNPLVSLPDANFTREALETLEFFGVIDFFLSETAMHADVVLAGSLQEEEEGVTANVEARVHPHSKGCGPARQRTHRFAPSSAIWRRAWAAASTFRTASRARSSTSCAKLRAAASPTITASPTSASTSEMGVFWPCPSLDHPGTPRLFEDGRFFHADGKAHFMKLEWRDSGDPVDAEFPDLPDHRTRGEPVSFRRADPAHRRAGGSVSRTASRNPSATGGAARNPDWRPRDHHFAPQRHHARRPWWCAPSGPDTVFIPYHWPGGRSANRLTHRTLDPRSKIPEFKVSACRIEKAARG